MSRMAQELDRQVTELRKSRAAGRRPKVVDPVDDGIVGNGEAEIEADVEPGVSADGAAPGAPVTAEAAEAGGIDMATAKRQRKTSAPKAKAAKRPKAARAAREPRAPKVRDVAAGLRTAPKLKGLLLGTEISRTVVAKALAATKFDGDEAVEAQRLRLRLEARQQ